MQGKLKPSLIYKHFSYFLCWRAFLIISRNRLLIVPQRHAYENESPDATNESYTLREPLNTKFDK